MTRAAAWAVRATALTAALWVVAAGLTGCGAAPSKLGPAGVDELTIPTPSPAPADFAGHATNPWFPLRVGTRWTYHLETPASSGTVIAQVLPQARDVDGITTTAVRWQLRDHGTALTVLVRWYAVDRAGNVWWFGQKVTRHGRPPLDFLAPRSFEAGRNGAEAGLVLTASPRVGDGYLNAQQGDVVERRSTVTSLNGTVTTTSATYRDAVTTRDLSSLEPLHTVQTFFARGLGMVAQQDTTSASTTLTLARVQGP